MTLVWFNLHLKRWSIRDGSSRVRHADFVRLTGVTFRVNEKARRQVVRDRCRQVHAYAVGTEAEPRKRRPARGAPVSYNPYRGPTFYRKDTGRAVRSAGEVWFLPGGRCFALDPIN